MGKHLKVWQVLDIYRRYWEHEPLAFIASAHGVSTSCVHGIGRGRRQASITGQKLVIGRRTRAKLPDNLVELYSRYSLQMLAIEFGVSRNTLRHELVQRGAQIRNPYSAEASEMKRRHYGCRLQIYERL